MIFASVNYLSSALVMENLSHFFPFRDCAIIIWRGVSKINGDGLNLNHRARLGGGGVKCNFLNICRGVRS